MMSALDLASHLMLFAPKFAPPSDALLDATDEEDEGPSPAAPSGNIRSLVFIWAQCIDCKDNAIIIRFLVKERKIDYIMRLYWPRE